jgi:hypothetical protein
VNVRVREVTRPWDHRRVWTCQYYEPGISSLRNRARLRLRKEKCKTSTESHLQESGWNVLLKVYGLQVQEGTRSRESVHQSQGQCKWGQLE